MIIKKYGVVLRKSWLNVRERVGRRLQAR